LNDDTLHYASEKFKPYGVDLSQGVRVREMIIHRVRRVSASKAISSVAAKVNPTRREFHGDLESGVVLNPLFGGGRK
jgi:hypothetical protein